MNNSLLVAILTTGGICSVIAAVIGGLFARRKMSAEAAQIVTSAGAGIAQQVEGYVQRISTENAALKVENADLRRKVEDLSHMVRQLKAQLDDIQRDTRATRHAVEHPDDHAEGQTYD